MEYVRQTRLIQVCYILTKHNITILKRYNYSFVSSFQALVFSLSSCIILYIGKTLELNIEGPQGP